jgi:hypothetical protein
MSINQFVGTWKLISGEFRTADGKISYPWGNELEGRIMYTADGNMAAQIMDPDRPKFTAKDHMKGTDEEVRAAFEGYQAYYGTYEVDEENHTIIHHVEGSVFPNLIGHDLPRFYELYEDGNRMRLGTPAMPMGGAKVSAVYVWEKLKR